MDNFFPSPGTKLTLLIAWQANKSTDDVLRQGIWTLSGKPASWEDSRLISQNKHLIGVWMPVSFIEEGEEIKLKGHLSCKIGGNLFISSLLQPFIGKQGEGNGNPLQYSCLENSMDRRSLAIYHPWGRKRVGHGLATKQQQQRIASLWAEQSHFSLTFRQKCRVPWGTQLCGMIVTKAMKSNG